MKFTFNKKARIIALNAIKKLEGGAFASSVLGAFSANPKVSAISSLILFVACRIGETIIAGIEDVPPDGPSGKRPPKAVNAEEDSADSG
jgi:hypothetical protein